MHKILERNLRVIKNCTHECQKGMVLIATYKSSRYPHFYPRDAAAIARALRVVVEEGHFEQACIKILEHTSRLLMNIQGKNGHWNQRYSIHAKDLSIYKQEDNTAHGISFLCNYLLAIESVEKKPKDGKKIFKQCMKALNAAIKDYFDNETGLFCSTTSIHEFAIETGFTLWTNCSYLDAMEQMKKISGKYGNAKEGKFVSEKADELKKNITKNLFDEGRFIARLYKNKAKDMRADITLMSPLYFGLFDAKKCESTIEFMRKKLWDKKLGLLYRFESEIGDSFMHNHAGIGPWIQYSAMLAQCYFKAGKKKKGEETLSHIEKFRSNNGFLPEHVASKESFDDFWKKEWLTGMDFEKEFNKEILLDKVDFDRIANELYFMARSYRKIRSNYKNHKRPYIRFGVPLAWSHAEFITATILREKSN